MRAAVHFMILTALFAGGAHGTALQVLVEDANIFKNLRDVRCEIDFLVNTPIKDVVFHSNKIVDEPYFVQASLCQIRASIALFKERTSDQLMPELDRTNIKDLEFVSEIKDIFKAECDHAIHIASNSALVKVRHATNDEVASAKLALQKTEAGHMAEQIQSALDIVNSQMEQRIGSICTRLNVARAQARRRAGHLKTGAQDAEDDLAELQAAAAEAEAVLSVMTEVADIVEFRAHATVSGLHNTVSRLTGTVSEMAETVSEMSGTVSDINCSDKLSNIREEASAMESKLNLQFNCDLPECS